MNFYYEKVNTSKHILVICPIQIPFKYFQKMEILENI
jgi:hypothetical protein